MPVKVVDRAVLHVIEYTAAELGLTLALVGDGTVVELVDVVPIGWGVKSVQVYRAGTITSAAGTVTVQVGSSDDAERDNIVTALDIEGTAGYISTTTVRYDSPGAVSIDAKVVTATAAATAVAGLRFEVELVKFGREN
jgi:hypothetical protein